MPSSMLRAYFDAGLQPKTRVYYIAGYVGFPDDWKIFDRKWRALLRQNDLPHFHMTDYEAGKNRLYREWSPSRRLAVMDRIVTLASNERRLGIATALLLADYDRLSEDERRALPPDVYGLCLTACIGRTAGLLHDRGMIGPIDYIFESGDAGQGTTKRHLEELFAIPANRKKYVYNSLDFAPKAKFPGLQLADILAWETGRFVPRALEWVTSPERQSFRALLEGNEYHSMLFDYDELRRLAASRG
jgi:hypothetical protein